MQPFTILKFLFGNRQAIIDIATCRGSLLLGGLLVLSAGFAREYDGEDLLHAPWYLLVPMVASFATCLLLYSLLYFAARKHAEPALTFTALFPRFLSLYWMTAPLAWLYAIPVEQFLEPAGAVRFNLSLLGIVSLWRVLLITRCASVLFGASYWPMFFPVLLFADTVALVVLFITPLPIFNIMGGIHLTESESLIQGTAVMIGFFGSVTWLVWLIATAVVIGKGKQNWQPLAVREPTTPCVSKSLWGIAMVSLFVWIPILPFSQPPLRLARQVERDLREDRITDAVRKMSAHKRESFPPHWDPPPRPGYGDRTPPLYHVLREIMKAKSPTWVRSFYLEKLARELESSFTPEHTWRSMDEEEFEQSLAFLESSAEGLEVARRYSETFVELIKHEEEDENSWRYFSDERKQLLRSLLETLEVNVPEQDIETIAPPEHS